MYTYCEQILRIPEITKHSVKQLTTDIGKCLTTDVGECSA